MSQQNIEILRSILEPINGIDVAAVDWGSEELRDGLERDYAPDVELRTLASGTGTGLSEVYRGWDGLVEYLQGWLEPFGEYHVEWLDYIEAGDQVLAPTRQWGTGAASGAQVELELTYRYELRDGKIARMQQYDTLEEARQAAAEGE